MEKRLGEVAHTPGFSSGIYASGFLMLVIASSVIYINYYSESALGILDYLGLSIWLIGYYFEVVGDRQLKDFLAKPENKGKIMKEGL